MFLTISGLPGSGTTTVSKLLAKEFRLKLVSSGEIFRTLAKKRGLTLAEFGALAESDPAIDLEIDQNQKEIAETGDNLILESRLGGHMAKGVKNTLKVWIKAPLEVRVKRIQRREGSMSFEEEVKRTLKREKSEALRYKKYYDIDIEDLSIYDVVLDSSKWDQYQIFEILKAAVNSLGRPE